MGIPRPSVEGVSVVGHFVDRVLTGAAWPQKDGKDELEPTAALFGVGGLQLGVLVETGGGITSLQIRTNPDTVALSICIDNASVPNLSTGALYIDNAICKYR